MLTQESQSATTLVDRMCAVELVERVRDPGDRRVVLVQLTRNGDELYEILKATAPAFADEMFGVLSPEDRASLNDLLHKFVQRNLQRLR